MSQKINHTRKIMNENGVSGKLIKATMNGVRNFPYFSWAVSFLWMKEWRTWLTVLLPGTTLLRMTLFLEWSIFQNAISISYKRMECFLPIGRHSFTNIFLRYRQVSASRTLTEVSHGMLRGNLKEFLLCNHLELILVDKPQNVLLDFL